MKVKWLGHSSFLITSDSGIKVITDPYTPNERLTYGEIKESANIVTVSHEHGDHNNVAAVGGNPEVVREAAKVRGITFRGIATYHDDADGSKRGNNTIFCFEMDGMVVCHLGDLGHPLSAQQVKEIGRVDILFIPVGGNYTIDAKVATEVCNNLAAKVVIPMHYQNERCPDFPVSGVDDFLNGKAVVSRQDISEVDIMEVNLSDTTRIITLQPAL